MIKFYKNPNEVIFEFEPKYEHFRRIDVGYCNYNGDLTPNDLYFKVRYVYASSSGSIYEDVEYIIKNANDDEYVTNLLLSEFHSDGPIPNNIILCNLYNLDTHEATAVIGGVGYHPFTEIPNDIYLYRYINKSNVLSNNTLHKYGILNTFNHIEAKINCSIVDDDISYINIKVFREIDDISYRNEKVYGVLENTPEGKEFVGFTFSPFSKKVDIKLGETLINDYIYNLYPVYDYIKIPTEEDKIPEIILYKNSAEKIVVNKTNYLTEVDKTVLTFRDECDIISPKIVLNRTDLDFNYVYIKSLKRYYFVNNITNINNNLMNVDLTIDILMSYKDGIRNLRPFVGRNEFYYDENIIDDKRVILNGHTTNITTIETNLFKTVSDGDGNEYSPNSLFVNGFNLDIVNP